MFTADRKFTIAIRPGELVSARTALDEWIEMRAITGIVSGQDFPVVWVCDEREWSEALAEHRAPNGDPWPADELRSVEDGALA